MNHSPCNVHAEQAGQIADLLVAIPHLVGVTPTDSLVAITITGSGQLALTARLDWDTAEAAPDEVGAHLVEGARNADPTTDRVWLIAVNVTHQGSGRSRRTAAVFPVLERMSGTISARGLEVTWAGRVDRDRWAGIACHGSGCGRHRLPDPSTSHVVANLVLHGSAPATSLDAVAAEFASEPDHRVEAVAIPSDTEELERWRDDTVADIWRSLDPGRTGRPDHDPALIAAGLSDIRVRDTVLWRLTRALRGNRDGWHRALDTLRATLRIAPEGTVADVAAVCALAAWQHGDGMRANEALRRARSADPDHSLARLVARAVDCAAPPPMWQSVMDSLTERECRHGCNALPDQAA